LSSPAPASEPTVRVLLVEDDELMRRSFAVALERYGYRVQVAGDGWRALSLREEGSTC